MKGLTSDTTFQIGELAARSGTTPDTLRYYERLGLLPQAQRTNGGFRVYSAQAVGRLRFITQARALGLTLQEIRSLVNYQTSGGVNHCGDVRDLLRLKMADLEIRIAELQAFQATLARYLQDCEGTPAGDDGRLSDRHCPVIEALSAKKR